jgi:uncharacterized protein (DUF2267 family)
MQYTEIIRRVEGRAPGGLSSEDAHVVLVAALGVLGDCLGPSAAGRLAEQLPKELQPALRAARPGRVVASADDFVGLVAEREQRSRSEAFGHTRTVLNVLAEAVTGHELQRVRAQLPATFETLFQPPAAARWPETHAPRPGH